MDGDACVILQVSKQSGANEVSTAEAVEAAMARKLHSCSEAMPRWWASSWAMVAGRRQAGLSTFRLDSPV